MDSDHIGHCPVCNGVIFKEAKTEDFSGSLSFVMKCPHCGSILTVDFSSKPTCEIKQVDAMLNHDTSHTNHKI
ncbi:hypothetical protein J7K86_02750 [bacterium]|nr:hypothetical protein [bacterium]